VDPLTLALSLGATARITRAVTRDVVLANFRLWVERTRGEYSLASYFVRCSWCLSAWVAAPVAAAAYGWGDDAVFVVPALALSLSYLTGLLSEHAES
jgi:hypothetical protein